MILGRTSSTRRSGSRQRQRQRLADFNGAGLHFEARTNLDVRRYSQPVGVITSTGYAERRPDGVHIIPIKALGH